MMPRIPVQNAVISPVQISFCHSINICSRNSTNTSKKLVIFYSSDKLSALHVVASGWPWEECFEATHWSTGNAECPGSHQTHHNVANCNRYAIQRLLAFIHQRLQCQETNTTDRACSTALISYHTCPNILQTELEVLHWYHVTHVTRVILQSIA